MRRLIFLMVLIFTILNTSAQEKNNVVNDLKAITNGTTIFYTDEGIDFTSQTFSNSFSLKSLKKIFRLYKIKKDDIKMRDKNLDYPNYYVSKNDKITDDLMQFNSYYFVEGKENRVSVFWFGSVNKQDRFFERKYISRVLNDSIPESAFIDPSKMRAIDFAGRVLKLSNNECHWANVNSIQCPYYGQISWSLHKSLEEAEHRTSTQILLTKSKKNSKVISEETVNVEFEGKPTSATKIIYDIKGFNGLLAGVSGAKNLTVYYVSIMVRGTYMSCVMSFWNNDVKTENGLPPLLDEIMKVN